ncbi:molybdopterin cofactor-binding domain-containing protein [Polaromonas sp.]|uniref:molybdopterin cofactor-binding domain-containing protein n=1 Tax=Polaromonas sp. TaxID=1869339 RepID=UPI0025CEF3B3|nr:molybdopterin cofactor-binding domain-containing protein [Polaromonas sp.]
MLGVFALGRILNMNIATSQALGDMTWGVGSALHEEGVIDLRFGFFVNHDLAEYPVPVHADIPAIEAIFLPEVDDKTNPLQIKGAASAFLAASTAALPSPCARLRWRSGKPLAWELDTLDNMKEPRFPALMPKPGFFIQSIIVQGFGPDGMGVKSDGFNSNFVGHHDGRHWQCLAGSAAQFWRTGTLHPAYAQPGRWCAAGNSLHASAARGV